VTTIVPLKFAFTARRHNGLARLSQGLATVRDFHPAHDRFAYVGFHRLWTLRRMGLGHRDTSIRKFGGASRAAFVA
jgi:hypothetical protein